MSDESAKAYIKKKVKAHIPKDWLKELRIVYRISLETIYGIKRTGWINLAIITTMAAILTIFGSLFRFTLSLNSFPSLKNINFPATFCSIFNTPTFITLKNRALKLALLNFIKKIN